MKVIALDDDSIGLATTLPSTRFLGSISSSSSSLAVAFVVNDDVDDAVSTIVACFFVCGDSCHQKAGATTQRNMHEQNVKRKTRRGAPAGVVVGSCVEF